VISNDITIKFHVCTCICLYYF